MSRQELHEVVRSYWFPIAAAIALAVAWGTSTAQIAALGSGQEKIDRKINAMIGELADSRVALSAAQTSAAFNTRAITDLGERLRAIEAHR